MPQRYGQSTFYTRSMMTPRLLIGVFVGAAVGLGAALLFEPIDERFDIGRGAPQAAPHALFAFQVDPSWIKAGTPGKTRGCQVMRCRVHLLVRRCAVA